LNNIPSLHLFECITTVSLLDDLDKIADYIALDKPDAAFRFVKKVFASVERLADHPLSGKQVHELQKTSPSQFSISIGVEFKQILT
jgi:plasmid stabilization system protein ParE